MATEKKKAKKKVVIMRGISGSGKSTYATANFPTAVVCSADKFFERHGNGYLFNPADLPAAHGWCYKNFCDALVNGESLVVVDNTNTRIWEMRKYIDSAVGLGYDVQVVRLEVPVHVAAGRNLHGVPQHAVQGMADRMEPYEGEAVVSNEMV